MIKITNGHRTFEVSTGAFESVYKDLGFHEVGVVADEHEQMAEEQLLSQHGYAEEDDEDEDEVGPEEETNSGFDIEALLEKPLSQWTPDELKEFVHAKSIDITGATKVSQVRGIVKKYLEEQAKND